MLKLHDFHAGIDFFAQPPLGGCVLKQKTLYSAEPALLSAAFRRLCVETPSLCFMASTNWSAAFRRLCVETIPASTSWAIMFSAAFRRLCVETKR